MSPWFPWRLPVGGLTLGQDGGRRRVVMMKSTISYLIE